MGYRPATRFLVLLIAVLLAAIAGWCVRDAALRGEIVRYGVPGVPAAYGWGGAVPYGRDIRYEGSLAYAARDGGAEPWGAYFPEDGRIRLREPGSDRIFAWDTAAQDVYLHELGHACLDDWLRERRGTVLGVATCRDIDGGPGVLAAVLAPRELRDAVAEYEAIRDAGDVQCWYGTSTDISGFGEWFAESFRGRLRGEAVPQAMNCLLDSIEAMPVP